MDALKLVAKEREREIESMNINLRSYKKILHSFERYQTLIMTSSSTKNKLLSSVGIVVLLHMDNLIMTHGFSSPASSRFSITAKSPVHCPGRMITYSSSSDNDESSPIDLDSADSYDEGAALAKELYERVRVLELKKKLVKEENIEKEGDLRQLNAEPFRKRKEMSSSGPSSNVKGKNDGGNPFFSGNDFSDGMFGRGSQMEDNIRLMNSQPFSSRGQNNGTARGLSTRQNFLLDAASSERNILIQIAAVSVLLLVAIGVGLNGGITDGSDRLIEDAVLGDGMEGLSMDLLDGSSVDSAVSNSDSVFI